MNIKLESITQQVSAALSEDIGSGDVTSALLDSDAVGIGYILSREPMVVCGQLWVEACFQQCSPSINLTWHVQEGDYLSTSQKLCDIEGPLCSILTAERTALNFLQTLSATATITKQYVDKLSHSKCQILDTRKTIPGLRMAQKYAVSIGGGVNHRIGLYDAYLIKENHINACGSITKAVEQAKQNNPSLFVEVEVENLQQLEEALTLPIDRIMLDNFDIDDMYKAVSMRADKQCELEVSGNVNIDSLDSIAKTGVDYISVGAITKSIKAIDLSLLLGE